MFDQAMYPIDSTEWCIYALFISDPNQIKKLCRLVVKPRNADLAYSLDGYMSAHLLPPDYKSTAYWKIR